MGNDLSIVSLAFKGSYTVEKATTRWPQLDFLNESKEGYLFSIIDCFRGLLSHGCYPATGERTQGIEPRRDREQRSVPQSLRSRHRLLSLSVRFHKFDDMIGLLEVLSFARSAQDKLTLAGLRLALEQSEGLVLEQSEGNDIFRLVTLNEVKSLNSTHVRICHRNYEQKHLAPIPCSLPQVPHSRTLPRRAKLLARSGGVTPPYADLESALILPINPPYDHKLH